MAASIAYFRQASAWAERDRAREPVVWPGLFDNPDGVSEQAQQGSAIARAVAVVRDNAAAWMYYFEIALPVFALLVLAASRDGFRPAWPQARAKLAMVAVLTGVPRRRLPAQSARGAAGRPVGAAGDSAGMAGRRAAARC